VNLVLVEEAEIAAGVAVIAGRRAAHVRGVLGAKVGDRIRAGVIGGALGTAELEGDDGDAIRMRLTLDGGVPAPIPVEVILALPRPKVLSRALETLASFAVAKISLTNAWRVDKSYFDSPRLEPAAIAESLRLGAEQGVTTHLPALTVHRRLMERLDAGFEAGSKLLAHPGPRGVETATPLIEPVTLAIGPEGGWIQRELETFVARGFTPVSLGSAVLRVESAIAAALGQLVLLRRLTSTAR
jgi:16S rRNA (uracil1498-N3)-methyltransferase